MDHNTFDHVDHTGLWRLFRFAEKEVYRKKTTDPKVFPGDYIDHSRVQFLGDLKRMSGIGS